MTMDGGDEDSSVEADEDGDGESTGAWDEVLEEATPLERRLLQLLRQEVAGMRASVRRQMDELRRDTLAEIQKLRDDCYARLENATA
jgi:hypothetical protein